LLFTNISQQAEEQHVRLTSPGKALADFEPISLAEQIQETGNLARSNRDAPTFSLSSFSKEFPLEAFLLNCSGTCPYLHFNRTYWAII
jgi:hypothetical protein